VHKALGYLKKRRKTVKVDFAHSVPHISRATLQSKKLIIGPKRQKYCVCLTAAKMEYKASAAVLDERLNLDEAHLFWCSLFRKYQSNFSPGKNTANGKK